MTMQTIDSSEQATQLLDATLHHAQTHLKKKLKWLLVLGTEEAGKTRLLNSGLIWQTSAGPDHDADLKDHTASPCNWWAAKNLGFIELPKTLNSLESTTAKKRLAQNFRIRQQISGLVLCIDLQAILAGYGDQQAESLLTQLQQLKPLLKKNLPVTLVFTKVDLVTGFNEFFSDLSTTEKQKAWGFQLPMSKADQHENINTGFEKLLQQLHARVIYRVEHERDAKNRALIADFPWQVESLKGLINQLVQQLSAVRFRLQGAYFTSLEQVGTTLDRLHAPLGQLFPVPSRQTQQNAPIQQAFFLTQLITPDILLPQPVYSEKIKKLSSHGTLISCLALIGAATLWWGNQLRHHVQTINQTQRVLTQQTLALKTQSHKKLSLPQIVETIDHLGKTVINTENHTQAWEHGLVLQVPPKMHRQAQQLYQATLNRLLLPQIRTKLETFLSKESDSPAETYNALQTYLMLGEPEHRQKSTLIHGLLQFSKNQLDLSEATAERLAFHLQQIETHRLITLPLDRQVIQTARKSLYAQPTEALVFALLNIDPSQASGESIHLLSWENELTIPVYYQKEQVKHMLDDALPAALKKTKHGNWVLGSPPAHLKKLSLKKLRHDYLENKTLWWNTVATRIVMPRFEGTQQTAKQLMALGSEENSPIIRLIETLHNNIGTTQPHLSKLSTFYHNGESSPELQQALKKIASLGAYIETLNQQPEEAHAFLKASQKQFSNQENPLADLFKTAETSPAPIKDWLKQLADNTWQQLLTASAHQLETAWQATVLPIYQRTLHHRYPLFSDAKTSITLPNFIQFFGQQGTLDRFFTDYLAPFVETQGTLWQLKQKEGHHLALSQSALEQFERATVIRKMFFADKNSLSVHFALQPIALSPNLRRLRMSINGKTFSDTHHSTKPHILSWPPSQQHPIIDLSFRGTHQKTSHHLKYEGPWALFQLLDQGHLQPTTDPSYYHVLLDRNGRSAKYELHVERPINPFIPGIVNHFRCPTRLT